MGNPIGQSLKQRIRSVSHSPGPENKRRKTVPEESMPWIATSIIEEESLRPELKLTLKYLKDWSIDPKFVRSSITNTASCPDFPYSEWSNIIAGRAVNLDHVYSSFYTMINDNRNVTNLGGIEITTDSGKTPSKTVKRDSEWRNAWEKTEGLYVYLMPHRLGELRKYGQHVGRIFLAINQKHHSRVIQYDKVVRAFVASHRDVLLGDYNEFTDIKCTTSIISDPATIKLRSKVAEAVSMQRRNLLDVYMPATSVETPHTSKRTALKPNSINSCRQFSATSSGPM
jgi:hypothetical protein